MNSKLRYYLRGLGIGMAVTALILSISGVVSDSHNMTDAEIISKAKELGMVDGSQYSLIDATANNQKEEQADLTPADSIAEQVNPSAEEKTESVQQGTNSDAEETVKTEATSDVKPDVANSEQVIAETEEKADVAAEEQKPEKIAEKTEAEAEEKTETAVDNKTETAAEETSTIDISAVEATPALTTEESTIVIRSGSGSEKVAKDLETAGLVDSANQFDKYLNENGYSRKIRVGTFVIPSGADYETIAKIITGTK